METPSSEELTRQANELLEKAAQLRKVEKAAIISEIKDKIAANKISADDLGYAPQKKTRAPKVNVVEAVVTP